MKRLLTLWCLLATICFSACFCAQAVELVPVRNDLTFSLFATHAGDGSNRLFYVEKGGVVLVQLPGQSTARQFLNIAPKVSAYGERGLLGLAFHPDFKNNRRFFVDYTAADGSITIAEYQASPTDPNVALTNEKILLTIPHPLQNHNGGCLAFGPDGYLYISVGDGGGANDPNNNAQNKNVLLGKILRIDVNNTSPGLNYAIPSDNPLANSTAGRGEIYALGLRNPWRFSFDHATGKLWCGDVGQDQREEVNIIARGSNYGWRIFEGTSCTGLDDKCGTFKAAPPLYEYTHAEGCSITGGYVYRGIKNTLPVGAYVFGDLCTGQIWMYYRGVVTKIMDAGVSVYSFGEDESGEIYVCSGDKIFRIDGASVGISSPVQPEGNSGTADAVFQVQLSSPAPQSVNLAVTTRNGTATVGSDYNRHTELLVFAPGETTKQVRVPVIGDNIPEFDETFSLYVARVYGVRITASSTGTATLQNDDGALRPPSNLSLTPTNAVNNPDEVRGFTAVYSDPDGATNIAACFLQVGPSLAPTNALRVFYNRRANLLYLRDDANQQWLGGFAPGSNNTISNSQGSLHCASTKVSGSGQNLTVLWSLSAAPAWQGTMQNLYLRVHDETGLQTGSTALGTWTINEVSQ